MRALPSNLDRKGRYRGVALDASTLARSRACAQRTIETATVVGGVVIREGDPASECYNGFAKEGDGVWW